MTFLAIVQSKGYQTIDAYLDSVPSAIASEPDFTDRELRSIRGSEVATEAYLEHVA